MTIEIDTSTPTTPTEAPASTVEAGTEVVADASAPPGVDAPASEPTPAAEPAKEESEKDPEGEKKDEDPTPRESAITRSLRKREASLVERQSQFARQREEHENDKRSWNEFVSRVKPQVDAFNQEREYAKTKPREWLEKVTGVTFEDHVREWMNGGKATTEQVIDRTSKLLAEEIAGLKKQLSERDQRESETKSQAIERQIDTEIATVGTDAAKYPTLSKAFKGRESALIAEVRRVAAESATAYERRTGQKITYTPEQVLGHIEKMKLEEYGRIGLPTQSARAVTESAAQTAPKGTEKTGHQEHTANGKPAPTLTGKGASQRAAMPAPDPLKLTPEEEKARIIAAIDEAKKKASTRAA